MDKRIEYIEESLMSCIENQMKCLEEVDAKELGEAIDMLKDLAEFKYYCSVTKAMEEYDPDKEGYYERDMDRGHGRMYYTDTGRSSSSSQSDGSHTSPSMTKSYYTNPMYWQPQMDNDYEYPYMRDPKEGKSPQLRKMYMEHKSSPKGTDKVSQMKELENYMQELTQDIVEMIEGASPEEKQYLNKKITALASKIV